MSDDKERSEDKSNINSILIASNIKKTDGYIYLGDKVSFRYFDKQLQRKICLIETTELNISKILDLLESISKVNPNMPLRVFISTYVAIILDNKGLDIVYKLNKKLQKNNENSQAEVFDHYGGNTISFGRKKKK